VTQRGVCAVFLGDSQRALEQQLRQEFPHAARIREKGELKALVAQVIGHIDGRSHPHTLPLDVRGTDFQRRVWAALQRIPRGQTRSYTQLAQAVGQPTATRAVASACAANKLAILIPCHRVVRADGDLSGYRWGQKRKRQLLRSEQRLPGRR
jgi:AraC family transcriptional regulator of adaptative response/methylated-DNA-[protein]-cysteine methyltransferase